MATTENDNDSDNDNDNNNDNEKQNDKDNGNDYDNRVLARYRLRLVRSWTGKHFY